MLRLLLALAVHAVLHVAVNMVDLPVHQRLHYWNLAKVAAERHLQLVCVSRPRIGRPQLGPHERFRAVEERVVDVHPDRQSGLGASSGQRLENRRIVRDRCPPTDTESHVVAWDDETEAHEGVGENVLKAEEEPVPGPVGDEEGRVVDDAHEAGRESPFGLQYGKPAASAVAS